MSYFTHVVPSHVYVVQSTISRGYIAWDGPVPRARVFMTEDAACSYVGNAVRNGWKDLKVVKFKVWESHE